MQSIPLTGGVRWELPINVNGNHLFNLWAAFSNLISSSSLRSWSFVFWWKLKSDRRKNLNTGNIQTVIQRLQLDVIKYEWGNVEHEYMCTAICILARGRHSNINVKTLGFKIYVHNVGWLVVHFRDSDIAAIFNWGRCNDNPFSVPQGIFVEIFTQIFAIRKIYCKYLWLS